MSRVLDPVPLLLGGLAGAVAGATASYTIDGRVDWPLVVAILVATIVTSLAIFIGAGPTRRVETAWRSYGAHPRDPGRWQMHAPQGGGPFDRFDDSAKRTLALAQDEAIRFNHNYIGTEHLLMALMRDPESVAGRTLAAHGVDLSKVRTAVEFIIGRGEAQVPPSEITLSPRTKRILELAADEARQLEHPRVGTGHLLLGLLREGEGIGAGVLQSLGVDFAAARAKVIELMPKQPPPAPPQAPPAT